MLRLKYCEGSSAIRSHGLALSKHLTTVQMSVTVYFLYLPDSNLFLVTVYAYWTALLRSNLMIYRFSTYTKSFFSMVISKSWTYCLGAQTKMSPLLINLLDSSLSCWNYFIV